MDDYQKIISNENKLKKLHQLIHQHSYISKKKKTEKYLQKIYQEVELWQKKVDFFQKKRKIRKNALELERERVNFYSKNITKVKNQSTYLHSKAEKKISEKFIEKYQKEMKDFGLQQKQVIDNLQKILVQKQNIQEKINAEKDEFEKETKDYEKQYDLLIKSQKELMETLAPEFQEYFFQLHEEKKFPAIVVAKEPYCTGCNMSFPPQIFQKALVESHSICSNCNRILVVTQEYFKK